MKNILAIIIISSLLFITLTIGCSKTSAPGPEPTPGHPYLDEFPCLSPDGARMIYYHQGIVEITENGLCRIDPDSMGLWMVNVDGSNPHIILNASSVVAQWSQDGNWIVFNLNDQIFKARISEDHIDTLSLQQLTYGDINFFPCWSPDGEWISYESNASYPGTLLFDIWKMKNDGSQNTIIREHSRFSHWSPRGDRIVYIYLGDGKQEIFSVDISGGDLKQVTTGGKRNTFPKYSPDGTRILFAADGSIFIVDDNGEELYKVFRGGVYPSWSLDGNMIVFTRLDSSDIEKHGTIWIMNTDGTDLRQVTRGLCIE